MSTEGSQKPRQGSPSLCWKSPSQYAIVHQSAGYHPSWGRPLVWWPDRPLPSMTPSPHFHHFLHPDGKTHTHNQTVSLTFMPLFQSSIDSCETRWGFFCSSCHMAKQMTESHHMPSPAVVCAERVQPRNLQSCPPFAVTFAWMIFFSLLSCQLLRLSCLRLRQGHIYLSQRRLASKGGVHTSFCREKEHRSNLACAVSCRPFKTPS